jgi:ribosome-binding factor A
MADKKQRIGAIVSKDLADIIWALKPDLTNLASLNEVEMNYDNSVAKVYVVHLDPTKSATLVNYLNAHKGVIRSQLASKLDIYKVPDLLFVQDDLYDKGAKIDEIIASWHEKEKKK